MTVLMDAFFVAIGFKADEIKDSHIRGGLYIGMIYIAGMATAFLIMAAI